MQKTTDLDDFFILIEAEKLSEDDDFMKYEPRNAAEDSLKICILNAISDGVKNFYRPKCDPSFTEDDKEIRFVHGKMPAVGKSFSWWNKIAKKHNPTMSSRLGTRQQYCAFLGVLIKKLVEEGKNVEWAWNAVCNDSSELGNYWDSKNVTHCLEQTGSREICGFCDLANTYKILAREEGKRYFVIAGGSCVDHARTEPLAKFSFETSYRYINRWGVGWIVFS